jgi:hypothetical protein
VLILILTACAEALALVLRFTAAKAWAAWTLALSTLPALGEIAVYFASGSVGVTASDAEFLGAELTILGLAVLSRWRLSGFFFWLGWSLNLVLVFVFAQVLRSFRPA